MVVALCPGSGAGNLHRRPGLMGIEFHLAPNLLTLPGISSKKNCRSFKKADSLQIQYGRPFWGFPELFSSPQNDEIFESLKMGYFIISKNSLRDSQKFAQPQNRVCISQKRSQKDSNLRPLLAA